LKLSKKGNKKGDFDGERAGRFSWLKVWGWKIIVGDMFKSLEQGKKSRGSSRGKGSRKRE